MQTALQSSQLKTSIPNIRPGFNVRVVLKVQEGDKSRLSRFEGLVIAKKHGAGITGTITVRKVVDGIGVERVFPIHSPVIEKIEVLKESKVRRAKLYYIRDKAAREVRKKLKSFFVKPKEVVETAATE